MFGVYVCLVCIRVQKLKATFLSVLVPKILSFIPPYFILFFTVALKYKNVEAGGIKNQIDKQFFGHSSRCVNTHQT